MTVHNDTPSLEDHPMAVFHAGEAIDTPSDRRWSGWVDQAAKLLDVSNDLDGDERADGYSLDTAAAAYLAGKTPADYAQGWRPAWALSGGRAR